MITFLTRKCFKIFCTIIIEIFIQCENNAKDKKNIKLFQIVGSTSNKNRLKSKCKTKEWVNLNFPSKGDRVKFVAQVNILKYNFWLVYTYMQLDTYLQTLKMSNSRSYWDRSSFWSNDSASMQHCCAFWSTSGIGCWSKNNPSYLKSVIINLLDCSLTWNTDKVQNSKPELSCTNPENLPNATPPPEKKKLWTKLTRHWTFGRV